MPLPPPGVLLGLANGRFPEWYPGQETVFHEMIDWYHSPARFLGASIATGSGKSVSAMLLAKMSGARTCILTATKGLQDQLIRDFGSLAVIAKGQNNFRCTLMPHLTADKGPCHDGAPCEHSRTGCPYRQQLKAAKEAKIVITNYAYYLAQTQYSDGLGDRGLLIGDEGHLVFSSLENYLTVFLSRTDIESMGLFFPSLPTSDVTIIPVRQQKKAAKQAESEGHELLLQCDLWSQWQQWADCCIGPLSSIETATDVEIKLIREDKGTPPQGLIKEHQIARSLGSKVKRLSAATGDWIVQQTRSGYLFTPRWVSPYGDSLFQNVPKIMIMSAVLTHKTANVLGIPEDRNQRWWVEHGSRFPPRNTPMYHIPTTRVNYRTDDFGTTLWMARVDQIIWRRMDRKGIVFTVSYDRARALLERSKYKDIMFTHSTNDVTYVVDKFKKASAPAVLVSPSVTTGFDFPGLDYIIIVKLPYPDTRDLVTTARHLDDNTWSSYLAMETLIQEAGRGSRGMDDACEVAVIDDNVVWFLNQYRDFSPQWFLDRWIGSVSNVPGPMVPKNEPIKR